MFRLLARSAALALAALDPLLGRAGLVPVALAAERRALRTDKEASGGTEHQTKEETSDRSTPRGDPDLLLPATEREQAKFLQPEGATPRGRESGQDRQTPRPSNHPAARQSVREARLDRPLIEAARGLAGKGEISEAQLDRLAGVSHESLARGLKTDGLSASAAERVLLRRELLLSGVKGTDGDAEQLSETQRGWISEALGRAYRPRG